MGMVAASYESYMLLIPAAIVLVLVTIFAGGPAALFDKLDRNLSVVFGQAWDWISRLF